MEYNSTSRSKRNREDRKSNVHGSTVSTQQNDMKDEMKQQKRTKLNLSSPDEDGDTWSVLPMLIFKFCFTGLFSSNCFFRASFLALSAPALDITASQDWTRLDVDDWISQGNGDNVDKNLRTLLPWYPSDSHLKKATKLVTTAPFINRLVSRPTPKCTVTVIDTFVASTNCHWNDMKILTPIIIHHAMHTIPYHTSDRSISKNKKMEIQNPKKKRV